jgi:signal transduction histidine kinase/CHASE2 domain-containing sensor protein
MTLVSDSSIPSSQHRWLALIVILSIVGVLTLFVLSVDRSTLHLLENIERHLLDLRFHIRDRLVKRSQAQVSLVLVDELTLKEYGTPVPRTIYADTGFALIRAKANVVAYNVLFLGERDRDGDKSLAKFVQGYPEQMIYAIPMGLSSTPPMRSSSNDVFPQMKTIPSAQVQSAEPLYHLMPGFEVLPSELFNQVEIGGTIAAFQERDGSIRKLPLLVREGEKYYPSLSLAVVCQLLKIPLDHVRAVDKYLLLDEPLGGRQIQIPIDNKGQMLINYQGNITYFSTRASLRDVYHAGRAPPGFGDEALLKQFRGKPVFIGSSADVSPTPFSQNFPGVAIHATIADNILNGDFLKTANWWVNLLLAGAFTIMLLLLQLFSSVTAGGRERGEVFVGGLLFVVALGVLLLYGGVSLLLFVWKGLVVNIAVPMVAMGSATMVVLLYRLKEYAVVSRKLYNDTQELAKYNEDIIENIASGLIVVNESGVIKKLNRKAIEILDLSDTDAVNPFYKQGLGTVLPPLSPLAETLCTGRGIANKAIQWNERHLQVTTSLLCTDTGEVFGAIEILNDVTDLNRLQEHLRRQERLAAIGGLAAELAHDIKNALYTILEGSKYLQERLHQDIIAQEELEGILLEGQNLDKLVRDLQDYAKDIHLTPQIGNLNEVVQSALVAVRHRLGKICVVQQLDKNLPSVVLDPEYLHVAIVNLLMNAIEAMGIEGTLTVSTSMDSTYVNLAIEDTGGGIPDEIQRKIFEPFVTGKRSGVGLGLARTYKIVDAHQGRLSFKAEPGVETCFVIELPLDSRLGPIMEEEIDG